MNPACISRSCMSSFAILVMLTAGCLPPPPEPVDADAEQITELIPALPGVGKQGQKIGDGGGLYSTPVAALFNTKQKVVFEIQIPQAMQLYHAEHEHYPKTHEEFMDIIIQFNGIKLPELPEGHEYVYDPDQGQLMVRRPVGQ